MLGHPKRHAADYRESGDQKSRLVEGKMSVLPCASPDGQPMTSNPTERGLVAAGFTIGGQTSILFPAAKKEADDAVCRWGTAAGPIR